MRREGAGGAHRRDALGVERHPAGDRHGVGVDGAWAQQPGALAGAVEDRRLHTDRARAAVEDQVGRRVEQRAELVQHVPGGGRADPAEPVGARRGDPAAAERGQDLAGDRVRRRPQADGVLAAGHVVAGARAAGEHQGERAGPQRLGEGPRVRRDVARPRVEVAGAADVDDQRVVGRAPLDREDAGHRVRLLGVGAEAVHGLGRQRDEPAGEQRLDGPRRVGGQQLVGRPPGQSPREAPAGGHARPNLARWAAPGMSRARRGWPAGRPARRCSARTTGPGCAATCWPGSRWRRTRSRRSWRTRSWPASGRRRGCGR